MAGEKPRVISSIVAGGAKPSAESVEDAKKIKEIIDKNIIPTAESFIEASKTGKPKDVVVIAPEAPTSAPKAPGK